MLETYEKDKLVRMILNNEFLELWEKIVHSYMQLK